MTKQLIPEGCMYINCMYDGGNYKEDIEDSITLVWKNKKGEKGLTHILEPEYTYYVTKDIKKQFEKVSNGYEYRYISLDEVRPVTCRYKYRFKSMADNTTRNVVKNFYKSTTGKNVDSETRKKRNQMHLFNEFHNSDVNITDYYIDKFIQINDQNECNYGLSISSFDIEVDGSDYPGFPYEDEAPCPVNLITYFNDQTNTLSVFMLKYETDTFNELINKKIKSKVQEVKKIYEPYFGPITVKPKVCSSELSLINSFFKRVHEDKPDYLIAWNLRFDAFTLWNRLKKLLAGTDITPEDIMCHPDFPVKKVWMKKDESEEAKKDFSARTDEFFVSDYCVWYDMLSLYGNITRPMGKKESYALNDIGLEETGLTKENLSAEDTSIKTAHLDNYSLFFKYGCIDTMLLALIAKNTGYVNLLHTIASFTRTRASKSLTKTVCLRNYVNKFYRENGYTISNNRCELHHYAKSGIAGAYVAMPSLIELVGRINGNPSNKCFDLVIDEDLSSMYPSILITFNISSSTAENKITVTMNTHTYEVVNVNGKMIKKEVFKDITREFSERYLSEDTVSYCHQYHNLPDYSEMYNKFASIAC